MIPAELNGFASKVNGLHRAGAEMLHDKEGASSAPTSHFEDIFALKVNSSSNPFIKLNAVAVPVVFIMQAYGRRRGAKRRVSVVHERDVGVSVEDAYELIPAQHQVFSAAFPDRWDARAGMVKQP